MSDADSWASQAIAEWERLAEDRKQGSNDTEAAQNAADPALAQQVEDARGAPGTSGWS